MASTQAWLSAIRPRTLFLSAATTICGSAVAYSTGVFSLWIVVLTILTATLLQLLSNMANDLGDFQHGTDTTGERVGPKRTVQSGAITPKEMKGGIAVAIAASALVGAILIYEAAQFISLWHILLFFVLGLLSIIAAITYTAGNHPYGYIGLGDIFSFVFFGLVSVVGTYFLHTHTLDFRPWLPAIGMGCFTVLVLNINNMRDIDNDIKSGKITIAGRLGYTKARYYHALVTLFGIGCFAAYSVCYSIHWYQFLYLLTSISFIRILITIFRTEEKHLLDPFLKKTSIATLILSVAFAVLGNW
ncbi:MAG: 1,4-dihydroxy-2-naphthoateoctaprenyltransferase [Bacteroidetes bacterium]|nr:1,4-dihydroxy-2-naphthoateoctaprenyltransferase [Bacteroidota bacterium]